MVVPVAVKPFGPVQLTAVADVVACSVAIQAEKLLATVTEAVRAGTSVVDVTEAMAVLSDDGQVPGQTLYQMSRAFADILRSFGSWRRS